MKNTTNHKDHHEENVRYHNTNSSRSRRSNNDDAIDGNPGTTASCSATNNAHNSINDNTTTDIVSGDNNAAIPLDASADRNEKAWSSRMPRSNSNNNHPPTTPGAVFIAGPGAASAASTSPEATTASEASFASENGEQSPAAASITEVSDAPAGVAEHNSSSSEVIGIGGNNTATPSNAGEGGTDESMNIGAENDELNSNSNPLPPSAEDRDASTTTQEEEDEEESSQLPTSSRAPAAALPVAEEYQEIPLIAAEAVSRVPTASATAVPVIFHVDIDGENGGGDDLEHQRRQETAQSKAAARSNWRHNRWLLPLIIVLALVTVIILAVLLVKNGNKKDADEVSNDEEQFPYPCYTSTLDIIEAQILAPADRPMTEPLIICPRTRIRIGTFRNPSRNDFNITGGDYPISVLRQNVTVQCGLDGKRSNNCTLDGGLAHVVTQDASYHPKYGSVQPTPTIDNFVMRGVTFTGQIQGAGVFGGVSVALSHPGKGARFEHCAWVDLTATKRLVTVGTNYFMELMGAAIPDMSVELTLSNCLLDNVIYEEELLVSFQQSFHIEDTTFRNVHLASLLSAGCGLHPNGCRNLLYCPSGGPSECSISNICVENMDTTGAGPIVISNETDWTSSGTNRWYGPANWSYSRTPDVGSTTTIVDDPEYEAGIAADNTGALSPPAEGVFANDTSLPFCALGVALYGGGAGGADNRNYTCLDGPPVFQNGTSESGCPTTSEWPW